MNDSINEAIYAQIADSYTEYFGKQLLDEIHESESEKTTYLTPRLDRKIRSLTGKVKWNRSRTTIIVAAILLVIVVPLVLVIRPLFTEGYKNTWQKTDYSTSSMATAADTAVINEIDAGAGVANSVPEEAATGNIIDIGERLDDRFRIQERYFEDNKSFYSIQMDDDIGILLIIEPIGEDRWYEEFQPVEQDGISGLTDETGENRTLVIVTEQYIYSLISDTELSVLFELAKCI